MVLRHGLLDLSRRAEVARKEAHHRQHQHLQIFYIPCVDAAEVEVCEVAELLPHRLRIEAHNEPEGRRAETRFRRIHIRRPAFGRLQAGQPDPLAESLNFNTTLGNVPFRFSSLSPGQVFIFLDRVAARLDCESDEWCGWES